MPSRDPNVSPCISVCRMDASLDAAPGGLCTGCLRTLDEIAAWAGAGAAQRQAIWARIDERAARLGPRPVT